MFGAAKPKTSSTSTSSSIRTPAWPASRVLVSPATDLHLNSPRRILPPFSMIQSGGPPRNSKQQADLEAIKVFRDNLKISCSLQLPAADCCPRARPRHPHHVKSRWSTKTGKSRPRRHLSLHQLDNDFAGSSRTLPSSPRSTMSAPSPSAATARPHGKPTPLCANFSRKNFDAIFTVMVNESGASIYSASDGKRPESPDLDLTVRGAISIARRPGDLPRRTRQDHPKSSVSLYQHDVDQSQRLEILEPSSKAA